MTVGCASNNCSRIEGLEFETHQGWYPSPTLRSGFDRDLPGPVAQRLEPAAHNGLVAGSSPARPTICISNKFKMLCHFASELGEKPSSRTQQFTQRNSPFSLWLLACRAKYGNGGPQSADQHGYGGTLSLRQSFRLHQARFADHILLERRRRRLLSHDRGACSVYWSKRARSLHAYRKRRQARLAQKISARLSGPRNGSLRPAKLDQEMAVGPAEAVLQGEASNHPTLLRSKGRGSERLGKRRNQMRQVWIVETNASEPLTTRRKLVEGTKTESGFHSQEEHGRNLFTDRVVSGVQRA